MIRPSAESQPSVQLNSVALEAQERQNLLARTHLTEQGVAICSNPVSGTVMCLAAVRVADGNEAEHIPLQQASEDRLVMPLPGDKPSKIGFFIDYHGFRTTSTVVRLGDYPGTALTTANTEPDGGPVQEVLISLAGIKLDELDETTWASQIGLFDRDGLAFDPARSRGVFSKTHQAVAHSGKWEQQRLVVVPQVEDLVEGAAPGIRSDVFQVLGYATSVLAPRPAPRLSFSGNHGDYDSGNTFMARRARQLPVSFEGRLSTGFGRSYEAASSVGQVTLLNLQAAFEISIAPGQ